MSYLRELRLRRNSQSNDEYSPFVTLTSEEGNGSNNDNDTTQGNSTQKWQKIWQLLDFLTWKIFQGAWVFWACNIAWQLTFAAPRVFYQQQQLSDNDIALLQLSSTKPIVNIPNNNSNWKWSATRVTPDNGKDTQAWTLNDSGSLLAASVPIANLGMMLQRRGKVLLYGLTGENCDEWRLVGTIWGSRSTMLFGRSLSLSQDASRIVVGSYESGQFTVLERQRMSSGNRIEGNGWSWNWKVMDDMPIERPVDKYVGMKIQISHDGSTIVTTNKDGFSFYDWKQSENNAGRWEKHENNLHPFDATSDNFEGIPKSTLGELSLSANGACLLVSSEMGVGQNKLYQRKESSAGAEGISQWEIRSDLPQISSGSFYFMDQSCTAVAFLNKEDNVTIMERNVATDRWTTTNIAPLHLQYGWKKRNFRVSANFKTIAIDVETSHRGYVEILDSGGIEGRLNWRKVSLVESPPCMFDPSLSISADGSRFAVGCWETGTAMIFTRIEER